MSSKDEGKQTVNSQPKGRYVPPGRRGGGESSGGGRDNNNRGGGGGRSYDRDDRRGGGGGGYRNDRGGGDFSAFGGNRDRDDRRGGGGFNDRRGGGGNFGGGRDNDNRGGGGGGGNTRWKDSSRNPSVRRKPTMERDERLEKELFGQVVTQGIDFDKYQDIPMEMSGNDYPEAMTSFEESKIHEVLLDNIKLCGYKSPTPIQKGSLAVCMKGRDLMGCAQTGSGKTAAFILPMAHVLLTTELKVPDQRNSNSYRRPKPCPFALILGPTRELVMQIYAESRKFMYRTGLRNVCVYGGAPSGQQIRELERGVDVVVATPGRLIDMITRGKLTLEVLKFLVLDEADRMLDMGFEPQIRDILEYCPQAGDRQTMMFSATFPNEIQALAQDFLSDYIFLSVGKVGDTANNVTQAFVYAPEREKNRELFKVLESVDGLTLIFVETKRTADYIERILCEEGIEATSIHGDRSQSEREEALSMFRCGRCPVMVATSVAARGLDIPNVLMVINYDCPSNIDDYVHRIGRTGRAGHRGDAVAFVNEDTKILGELHDSLKEHGQEVEDWFAQMAKSCGFRRGGGGKKKGGKNFGGRDYRRQNDRSDDRGGGGGGRDDRRGGGGGGYGGGFSRGGGGFGGGGGGGAW